MKLGVPTIGFSIMNNVEIQVIDGESNQIKKTVRTHNKATRQMVTGILRFLEGYLTKTSERDEPLYNEDFWKQFIPCYFNVGDGGVVIQDGTPMSIENHPEIPAIDSGANWTEAVDYLSTHLMREYNIGLRTKIRKQTDTLDGKKRDNDTLSDDYSQSDYKSKTSGSSLSMDSLYFECEIQAGQLNNVYGGKNAYVTELGLFAGSTYNTHDLLAYVKLNNYDNNTKTNALYVKPQDVVVVRWVITIAAIGKDNILVANIKDETGKLIVDDVEMIPEGHYVEIMEYPVKNQNGGD